MDLKEKILEEIGQKMKEAEEEQEELVIEVVPCRTESREKWEEYVREKEGQEENLQAPGLKTRFVYRPWEDRPGKKDDQ